MLHTFDVHRGNRRTGEGGEQHTAKRVAQRMAKPTLQRLDHEDGVTAVLVDTDTVDACLFEF